MKRIPVPLTVEALRKYFLDAGRLDISKPLEVRHMARLVGCTVYSVDPEKPIAFAVTSVEALENDGTNLLWKFHGCATDMKVIYSAALTTKYDKVDTDFILLEPIGENSYL